MKPDCQSALQRKGPQKLPRRKEATVSPVQFAGKIREIAGISGSFQRNAAKLPCSADCVAEGEGFEPSVRFYDAKSRHIRKLQIAKAYQRISHQNPTSEFCNQSGFDSPFIRHQKANAKRFCGREWSLCEALGSLIRFACDSVPSGQSQNRNFLPLRELHRSGFVAIVGFLPVISHLKLLEGSQFPSSRPTRDSGREGAPSWSFR